jgi:hypothetical protein
MYISRFGYGKLMHESKRKRSNKRNGGEEEEEGGDAMGEREN